MGSRLAIPMYIVRKSCIWDGSINEIESVCVGGGGEAAVTPFRWEFTIKKMAKFG